MKGSRGRIALVRSMCAMAFMLGTCLLLPSSALALEHPFLGTFGSPNEPSFTKAEGLAFDQSSGGRLLVIDAEAGTVSRWNVDGTAAEFTALGTNVIDGSETPEGELSFGGPGEVQVAVDNSGTTTDGNIYVPQFAGPDVVDIFAEDGSFVGQLTESSEGEFGEPCGVAVDPDGDLYVGDFSGHIHKFANPPVDGVSTDFPFSGNCTLAAGAAATDGFLFPAHFFGALAKLDASTGEEKYEVDSGPTTTVSVNPATGALFSASGNEVKEFDASSETEATPLTPIEGEAKVMGIAVDGASGNIYVAREGNSHIEVYGPAVNLPKVTTEEATVVDGVVTLHGVVDADEGPPATCVFQYVEVSAEGFNGATSVPSTPPGPFSAADGPTAVSAQISGLPEAAFRFRLLCDNGEGSKAGQALLFNTFEQLPGLPDNRAYEMVSPPEKAGEVIPPEPSTQLGGSCGFCLPGENTPVMPMQSAPDGESVLYEGQPFSGGLAAGPNEYVAPRSPSGWGIEFLSLPSITGVYEGFSDDLSRAVLSQAEPALSPQAPTREGEAFANLYLRQNGEMQPLITEEPPNREPGTPSQAEKQRFRPVYAGANAGTPSAGAFGHVIFEANDALTEEVPGVAPAAPEVEAGEVCGFPEAECNLYEWVGGGLRLVNVLPNESAASDSVIGSGRLLATGDPQSESADVAHAISNDGSRIFWSTEETGQVYVRVEGKETLEVPGSGSCKKSEPLQERACFLTASADGSSVLLSNGTLYELNGAGTAYEEGADLTEGEGGFQGILGAAEDLSQIYFVEEEAEGGELNLYSWEEGEASFLGILQPTDNEIGVGARFGAWKATSSNRTAQVSPDGSWLAFMSLARLTGYDNTLSGGGNCRSSQTACQEVFVYSANSEELSCASCNPTGQRPLGPSTLSLIRPSGPPFRQPANLSPQGEGRVFFESLDTLVSRDTNGRIQDIYEWEPQGVGSCKRAGGCAYLISSGNSPKDSLFLDSSSSGDDAFFITREQLLPRDKDEQLDLYDARVGGGFPEASEPSCSGEACKGPVATPPAQPSFGTEESSSGNPPKPKPKHCKKGFVKKHGKCVKKKPKKHHRGGSK
jgi:hypothetical protein